jgi:hypothetical protein
MYLQGQISVIFHAYNRLFMQKEHLEQLMVSPERKYIFRWKTSATCAYTITQNEVPEGEKEEYQLSSKSKTCYQPGIFTCHLNVLDMLLTV